MVKEYGGTGDGIVSGGYIEESEYNLDLSFPFSIDKYQKMRNNDVISTSLSACKSPILGAKYEVRPPEGEEEDELTEFVRYQFFEALDFLDFVHNILFSFDYGFSLFEKVYKFDKEVNKIVIGKMAVRLPDSIQKWEMSGGQRGIEQQAIPKKGEMLETLSIPENKLWNYIYQKHGDSPVGISMLRSVVEPYDRMTQMQQISSVSADRMSGIPYAEPANPDKPVNLTETQKTSLNTLLGDLRTSENAFINNSLPNVKIGVMVPDASKLFDYLGYIEMYERRIQTALYAKFLSTGNKQGGYSQSKNETDYMTVAMHGHVRGILSKINNDLVKDVININYTNIKKYPQIVVTGLEDMSIEDLSNAIQSLSMTGMRFDDEETQKHVREQMNLPPPPEEPEDPEPEPEPDPEDKNALNHYEFSAKKKTTRTKAEEVIDVEAFQNFYDAHEKNLQNLYLTFGKKNTALMKKTLDEMIRKNLNKPKINQGEKRKIIKQFSEEIQKKMNLAFDFGLEQAESEMKVLKKRPDKKAFQKYSLLQAEQVAIDQFDKANNWTMFLYSDLLRKEEFISSQSIQKEVLKKLKTSSYKFAPVSASISVNQGIDMAYDLHEEDVWGWQFSAIIDGATCFPENTKIITKDGEKNIQDIRIGDMVLTRKGFKKILVTNKSEYTRKIYIISCKNSSVECTDNHPFWTIEKGWVNAQDLEVGNKIINFSQNIIREIFSRIDLDLSDSQHMESFFSEKGISFDILSRVSVPITSINLKT